jgi:tetratricopeptide (TPR) repeat protein
LWRTGATYIHQGDAERGVQYCEEALALRPLPYDVIMAKGMRGYGKVKAGLVDAGITDLTEAVAGFENSSLRYGYARYALWLVEGHLRRGDRAPARALIQKILEISRSTGYLHLESLACSLMAECLAPEDAAAAEPYIENAMEILERIGARNDLARAIVTGAALRQATGDLSAARDLLNRADAIFQELHTIDGPVWVEAARAALDRGAAMPLLGRSSR